MDGLMLEVRHALRNARRRPGFFAAVVLTLALGIGANTAIFTLLNALVLRPLPYEDPDRLVHVWENVQRDELERREFSYPDFLDIQERSASFAGLAAYADDDVILGDRAAGRFRAETVTRNYFPVLGVHPLAGKTFSDDPDQAATEVVIGFDLWQRALGADEDVLGQTVTVDGAAKTVVGVMAQSFRGLSTEVDLWTSMSAVPKDTLERRGRRWHRVVGRLEESVDPTRADEEVSRVFAQLLDEIGGGGSGYGIEVVGLRADLFGDLRQPLSLLFGAVGFVLLIACANVANLLLIRATGRRRESALRTALGASRLGIARQHFVEALLLTFVGAGLALLLAGWGVELLVGLNPIALPGFITFELAIPVLLFNLFVACVTAFALAAVETFQIRDLKVAHVLRAGSRGGAGHGSRRSRRLLVVTEMALAMVLLIGAGLMTRSLHAMRQTESGFDARDLVFFRVDLPGNRYAEKEASLFAQRLLDEVEAVPGVDRVALGRNTPLDGNASGIIVRIEGQDPPEGARYDGYRVHRQVIAPGFFDTLGIEVLKGRDFGPQDKTESQPVIIISESLAHRFDGDPIGQQLEQGDRIMTIVGVASDVRHRTLIAEAGTADDPDVYFPFSQAPSTNFAIAVRSTLATAVIGPIRKRLEHLEPQAVVYGVRTIEERLVVQVANPRFHTVLLTLFASLALILATLGLTSVMGYNVVSRQREIGIRMALGARKIAVLGMVMREGLVLILSGTACGLGLALAMTRVLGTQLETQLYQVRPGDFAAFAGMTLVLVVVTLGASLIPARRATRVDPIISLRQD